MIGKLTGITLVTLTENVPPGRSLILRPPRARSYSTAIICRHQDGTPYFSPSSLAMTLSSWPSSSLRVSSILPRVLAAMKARSQMRGTAGLSPSSRPRRSALETMFSMLAIDMRTLTPDC